MQNYSTFVGGARKTGSGQMQISGCFVFYQYITEPAVGLAVA